MSFTAVRRLSIIILVAILTYSFGCFSPPSIQQGVLVKMASGDCIPRDLETVVLPKTEELYKMLEIKDLTPEDIINYLDNSKDLWKDNPVLEYLLKSYVKSMIKSLKGYGNIKTPFTDEQLMIAKNKLRFFRSDVKESIQLVNQFDMWCK